MRKKTLIIMSVVLILTFLVPSCTKVPPQETPADIAPEATTAPQATAVPEVTTPPETAETLAPMTLKVWAEDAGPEEQIWYESVIASFNEKYPNITVETNFVDYETYRSLITVAMASDDPPDVFKYWSGAWPKYMADQGLLEDLTDWWDKEGIDERFAPWAKALNTYDGSVYGVPTRSYTSAMFYNVAEFEKYGLVAPEDRWPTWDQMIGYCQTIRSQGGVPIVLAGKGSWPLEYILGAIAQRMDGEIFWNDLLAGKESWTDPRVTAWFMKWKELSDAGCFAEDANSIDWSTAKNNVFDGVAVMTFGLSSVPRSARSYAPDVVLDFFHFPVINAEEPNKMMHHETDSFFLAKSSKNKEAAYLWLKHVTELEEACKYSKLIDEPPARIGVTRDCYADDAFGELLYKVNVDRDTYPGPISLDIGLHPEVSAEAMRQIQLFMADPSPETITAFEEAVEASAELVRVNMTPP